MQKVNGDIFTGVLTKAFKVEKGFKGIMEMKEGKVGISVGYDGKLADTLKNFQMKEITVCGTLHVPADKMPYVEVREIIETATVIKRGRVATTPELRYTQNGIAYASFKLAVNHGYGDNRITYFYSCTLWGNEKETNPAISFVEKIDKGQELIVRGRPQFIEKEKILLQPYGCEYELIRKPQNAEEKRKKRTVLLTLLKLILSILTKLSPMTAMKTSPLRVFAGSACKHFLLL